MPEQAFPFCTMAEGKGGNVASGHQATGAGRGHPLSGAPIWQVLVVAGEIGPRAVFCVRGIVSCVANS